MVVVEEVTKLSERRTQTSSEAFPDESLASIQAAVEAVPASVFDGSTKHTEVGAFDVTIADGLSQYEYEGDAAGGYNPNCKLWSHQGFNYSVDTADVDDTTTENLVSDIVDANLVTPVPEGQVLIHEPSGTAFDSPTQLAVFHRGWAAATPMWRKSDAANARQLCVLRRPVRHRDW